MFSKFLNFYRKNRDYCLLILSIIVVASPLILYNLPVTSDGHWHLIWAYYWNQQVSLGQFYPRWFENAFGGLGTPTFSFYPPLFRSLSFPFSFLGLSATQQIIGTIIIVFLINGLGSLIYANLIFRYKARAFIYVSALLAIFNPYLLINIFFRGAWAEACAMSLIPWILIGTKLSLESNRKLKELPLLISYSFLAISHLPTLLIVTFLYLSYTFFLITQSLTSAKKYIINVCLPIGLSFFLTSFYLVPAYFDRALTNIYSGVTYTKIQYQDTPFLIDTLDKILDLTLNFSSFRLANIIVYIFFVSTLLLTILMILLMNNRPIHSSIFLVKDFKLIIFLSFVSLLMNTSLSRPIYFFIPVLNEIQFPWRFLSVSSTLIPFMCTAILCILAQKLTRKNHKLFVKVSAIFFFISLGIFASFSFRYIKFDSNSMEQADIYLSKNFVSKNISINTDKNDIFNPVFGQNDKWMIFLTNKHEILTIDVIDYLYSKCFNQSYWNNNQFKSVMLPKQNYPLIEWDKGFGKISSLKWDLGLRQFKVKTNTISTLNLKTLYYPGWKVSINPVSLTSDLFKQKPNFSCTLDGRIQLNLPPGEFNILISYDGTNAENIATYISLISLISAVIYFLFQFFSPFRIRR